MTHLDGWEIKSHNPKQYNRSKECKRKLILEVKIAVSKCQSKKPKFCFQRIDLQIESFHADLKTKIGKILSFKRFLFDNVLLPPPSKKYEFTCFITLLDNTVETT